MLRSFITWLDDYLAGEAPSALVKAVVGLLSFAALLGALLGDLAVRTGFLAAAVLAVVSLGLMLLADRRTLRRRAERAERQVFHYVRTIHAMGAGYRVTSWDKTIVIAPNGDARDIVKVRAVVEKPGVQFFWLWFGCYWPQPARYQKKVAVQVRNLLVGDLPGTSLERTLSWSTEGRLAVIAHMHAPPRVGSVMTIQVEIAWPAKCVPLVRGDCDSFTIRLGARVDYARYRIVLPKGYDTYCDTIGFQDGDPGFVMEKGSADDGCPSYQVEVRDLAPDQQVGLRLELKQRAPIAMR
ncbi:hypothetical protein [Kutzneria sp. NPDC052558]|uniref:hypothetical protein n=1 Tax=Kutzneria sp. NPDC052558 TaxID=3364121 RepID=UPI0037C6A3F3